MSICWCPPVLWACAHCVSGISACSGWATLVFAFVTLALGLRAGGAMGHYLAAEAAPMVILAALLWFGAAASILHWCAPLRYHD